MIQGISNCDSKVNLHQLVVKQWEIPSGCIKLFFDHDQGLYARVLKSSKNAIVSSAQIIGIPKELKSRLSYLSFFLRKTYVKLVRLGHSHYKIYIHQRGLGGGPTHEKEKEEVQSYTKVICELLQQVNTHQILNKPNGLQILDSLKRILEFPLFKEGESVSEYLQMQNQTLIEYLGKLKTMTEELESLVNNNMSEIGQMHQIMAKKLTLPLNEDPTSLSSDISPPQTVGVLVHVNEIKWQLLNTHSLCYEEMIQKLNSLSLEHSREMTLVSSTESQISDLNQKIAQVLKEGQVIQEQITTLVERILRDLLDQELKKVVQDELERNDGLLANLEVQKSLIIKREKKLDDLEKFTLEHLTAWSTYE